MKNEEKDKMKTIVVTQEEINQATRPDIYRNRKKYTWIRCYKQTVHKKNT